MVVSPLSAAITAMRACSIGFMNAESTAALRKG